MPASARPLVMVMDRIRPACQRKRSRGGFGGAGCDHRLIRARTPLPHPARNGVTPMHMHRRPFAALGGAMIALGATLLTLPGAGASPAGAPGGSAAGTASACQSNLNPADDTTMAVSAQQFVGSSAGIWTKGASLVRIPA